MGRVALDVRVPAIFVIGATSELEVVVTAERETHHDGIHVELARGHVVLARILVVGSGTLRPGTTRFGAKLAVPSTRLPAAHALRASIALPWRIDPTFACAVRVVTADDPVARDPAALVVREVDARIPVPDELRTIIVAFALSRGWTVSDPDSFATVALGRMIAIEKPRGTHELAIGVARRGEHDYVVARCAYPRLGVTVDLLPCRPLEVTWPRWLVPVARPIDVLPAARITAADDTHVVFEHPVTRLTKERLGALAQVLENVSREVETARLVIETPVTCDREGWRILATDLGGHLAPGDFGISGALRGMPVTTAFVAPRSLRITVGEYAETIELAVDASSATVRGHIERLRALAARAAEIGPYR